MGYAANIYWQDNLYIAGGYAGGSMNVDILEVSTKNGVFSASIVASPLAQPCTPHVLFYELEYIEYVV